MGLYRHIHALHPLQVLGAPVLTKARKQAHITFSVSETHISADVDHIWTKILTIQTVSHLNMPQAPFEPYHAIQSTHYRNL